MSDFSPHPLLSERSRLVILATLATSAEPIEFLQLLRDTKLTKGNLSVHVRKLEEAGLVEVIKEFIDRKSHTRYRCTKQGRRELKSYLASVERLLKDMS